MISQEQQWLLQEKYHDEKSDAFHADCNRLNEGEPLAYIIGSIPFLNTTIYLDSKPLIPRPETEFWVEKSIQEIKLAIIKLGGPTPKLHILDLCAGSGCIGVAVLKAIANTHVTFAEIDENHAPTVIKNCELNGISRDRYSIAVGNLFTTIPKLHNAFDYILTNPPYIDKKADTVEKNVVNNEPNIALFGGAQGFEIIAKIIVNARAYLKVGGVIYLEHEPSQTELIQTIAASEQFSYYPYVDQYNIFRYSKLILF